MDMTLIMLMAMNMVGLVGMWLQVIPIVTSKKIPTGSRAIANISKVGMMDLLWGREVTNRLVEQLADIDKNEGSPIISIIFVNAGLVR